MTHPEQAAAHTPGPWEWIDDGLFQERNGDAVMVATFEYDRGADIEVSDADARLIAAAPDLLEALKRLESTARILPESMDEPGSAMSQARAAISRAEGRTEPKAGE